MTEDHLRALERKARETRDILDVQAYCEALERLGTPYLQKLLGTGRDWWQNLIYRRALKQKQNGNAGLDLTLPHKWTRIGGENYNFGMARAQLAQECQNDPWSKTDDKGLHPFFAGEARPLTFKETIQARMEQWRTFENAPFRFFKPALDWWRELTGTPPGRELWLWNSSFDTCTAIVWEQGANRFKIVPGAIGTDVETARRINPLLTVRASNAAYVPVSFANTPGTPIEVDSTYNRELTFEEVITHKGWIAALEGDVDLLREYATVVFGKSKRTHAMSFWTLLNDPSTGQAIPPDHARPLAISSLDVYSRCIGYARLSGDSCIVRISPP